MADSRSKVGRLLRRAVEAGMAPGLVAGWGRDGQIASCETAGAAELFPKRRVIAANAFFDLASLTKPLVTTSLSLVAFRSGGISPSTRVGNVLDELRGAEIGELEVEDLLTHTSGLPAWLPLYCLADGEPIHLLSSLSRVEMKSRPGESVVYSCVGFILLGLMLARLADTSLDALFRREVLLPLALGNQFGFCPELDPQSLFPGAIEPSTERRLVGELGFDPRWIPSTGRGLPDDGNARFLGGVAGNAGLFGTASGVLTLSSEYLPGGGSLLTSEEAEWATALRTGGLEQGRGWGWQLASSVDCSAGPALSANAYGHTGYTGVSVWCDPVSRGGFVLLTNRNHPAQRENDLHPIRRRFHALAASQLLGGSSK